jgi:hypothetical protein
MKINHLATMMILRLRRLKVRNLNLAWPLTKRNIFSISYILHEKVRQIEREKERGENTFVAAISKQLWDKLAFFGSFLSRFELREQGDQIGRIFA